MRYDLETMIPAAKRARGQWWSDGVCAVAGCTRCSPSCDHCWYEGMTHRLFRAMGEPWRDVVDADGRWTGGVHYLPERMERAARARRPRAYSVWGDLFHEGLMVGDIAHAFATMAGAPEHLWFVLTKRAWRAAYLLTLYDPPLYACASPPANVVIGTTLDGHDTVDRLTNLRECAEAGWPTFASYTAVGPFDAEPEDLVGVRWLVVECESGPGRRVPRDAWLDRAVGMATEAGVPLLVKQWDEGGQVVHLPCKQCDDFPTFGDD